MTTLKKRTAAKQKNLIMNEALAFINTLFADQLFLGLLGSAFLLGIMGSSHCLGMCGGISAALGFQANQGHGRIVAYNAGRISTYTAIGLIAGLVGETLTLNAPLLGPVLRSLAGLLLVAMGFYIAGWWMGLTRLEKIGSHLWRHVQPLTQKLLPVHSNSQALKLGLLWGLLPCGLIYSTLSWALATANGLQSALLMLAFGLGTLPSMLVSGMAGKKVLAFLRQQKMRAIAAILMIALGLVTAVTPWQHLGHHQHGAAAEPETPMHEHHHH